MPTYDSQTIVTTAELAAVAAVAYIAPDGVPAIEPVTPLLFRGDPAFTLPFARSALVREISSSPRVAFVFSDSRLAYVGWNSLAVTGRTEVTADPDGELFRDELLHQELRKFPPDRQLIGNMLLQRENWWYLPRFIVRLAEAEEPRPVARRAGADYGVLACEAGGLFTAETVRVEDWDAERIPVRASAGQTPLLPEGVPAALFLHDFAVPDMDPRTSFLARGRMENGRLLVSERRGSPILGKRPGLLARWRAQRDLERRCKAGIRSGP
ncbi:MAG TPA: hypothetical protein VK869_06110 [Rubrobacteraceae bacterium]|nr:hypothetical protein [Rubrobacteraceae bacterium]